MIPQQKAEGDLLKVFSQLIAVVLLLILMSMLALQYLRSAPDIASRSLQLEHTRLMNVLVMVKSQWIALGKPHQMVLRFEPLADSAPTTTSAKVTLSPMGMPEPETADAQGCMNLWRQLLGTNVSLNEMSVEFVSDNETCMFTSRNGERIVYGGLTGKVAFLTKS